MRAGSAVHNQSQRGGGILPARPEGSAHFSTQAPGKGGRSQAQPRVLQLHCCHEQKEDASSPGQMRLRSGPRAHKDGADGPETERAIRQPEAAGRLPLGLSIALEDAVQTQHSSLGTSSWGQPSASISVFTMGCPELL